MQKIITNILPSIIRSQDIDLNPRGIFNQGLQFKKNSHTSDFFLRKKTHVYLEKSSIKVIRYLDTLMEVTGIILLISECIISNMHVARFSFPRLNLCSGCFPITQPLQIPVVALMTGRPSKMVCLCNCCKYLKLIWENLSCHNILT